MLVQGDTAEAVEQAIDVVSAAMHAEKLGAKARLVWASPVGEREAFELDLEDDRTTLRTDGG